MFALIKVAYLAFDKSTYRHLQITILDITQDTGLGRQFNPVGNVDVAAHLAVEQRVGHAHITLDTAQLALHQKTLILSGLHRALYLSIDMKAADKGDITQHPGALPNNTGYLRQFGGLGLFSSKEHQKTPTALSSPRGRQGKSATASSPNLSSRPSIRFMFWIA